MSAPHRHGAEGLETRASCLLRLPLSLLMALLGQPPPLTLETDHLEGSRQRHTAARAQARVAQAVVQSKY
jgi:hypothetical protein